MIGHPIIGLKLVPLLVLIFNIAFSEWRGTAKALPLLNPEGTSLRLEWKLYIGLRGTGVGPEALIL